MKTKMTMLSDPQRILDISNVVYIGSAFLAVIATFLIVTFGNRVARLKETELKAYQSAADARIADAHKASDESQRKAAEANKDAETAKSVAATANAKAEEARLQSEKTAAANIELKIELARQEAENKKTTAELAAATEKVQQFAQGVAVQQQGMARQMQVTPSLSDMQIQILANQLKTFAGQKVSVHSMLDARATRLAGQFTQAFQSAGLTVVGNSTDVGPNYTGIMIAVHEPSPAPHPPLADALIKALTSMGVPCQRTAYPTVPADQVWVLIGPQ